MVDSGTCYSEMFVLALKFKPESDEYVFEKLQGLANQSDDEIKKLLLTSNQNDLSAAIQGLARLVQAGETLAEKGKHSNTHI